MKLPRQFFKPLAIGAPAPLRELPVRLERMIHFVPPHLEKLRAKVPQLAREVDVVLGNLEDAIPADAKEGRARRLHRHGSATDFGTTGLWTRINALNSPWALDDMTAIVAAIGNKLDVVMLPKVDGAVGHPLSRSVARAARSAARREKADPDPRHPGDRGRRQQCRGDRERLAAHARHQPRPRRSRGLARDEDDARRRRTSRLQGAGGQRARRRRACRFQQDLWHYTLGKMVDACAAAGIKPFYGPFGDFSDPDGCEAQFRNAFLMGCAGAWSLHPTQVAIAKKVFSPDPAEVAFARKILDAMPDGTGAVMIDGKMQDDATWKQAKVVVDLARLVAAKDPEMGKIYGL